MAFTDITRADVEQRARGRSWNMTEDADLTDREHEVLVMLARHYTYSQAASELSVSLNTVKSHVSHLYAKLGANIAGRCSQTSARSRRSPPR